MLGRNNNTKKRPPPPFLPPSIVGDDSIAGRTRRQKRAIASKWDIQTPIIIEIINWLDQESLMNLSLVSRQLHNIIANEPGNRNRIIPVFEVSGSSTRRLFQILRDNFFNKGIKNKLQYYPRMKFNNIHEFDRFFDDEWDKMQKDVRMDWITSLDISSSSSPSPKEITLLPPSLSKILPKVRELDFSRSHVILLRQISWNCPLLEKITADNLVDMSFTLDGHDMGFCNNLKEIYMDHSSFCYVRSSRENVEQWDFFNKHEIFMFHYCCKALERVSVRNMKFKDLSSDDEDDDGDPGEDFTQNSLIKFVRNAPPSLHWFRSDLTPDNITMLRMERPGIEFLN
jgi:hypothetical protein